MQQVTFDWIQTLKGTTGPSLGDQEACHPDVLLLPNHRDWPAGGTLELLH